MKAENKPKKGEFYSLVPDLRIPGPGHGVVFENLKQLLTPPRRSLRPSEGGFPPLREMPRLVHDPNQGDLPLDLEASFGGYWLVSERLKKVFEKVDRQAFEFREVDFRLADGSRGGVYFLCDVVRVLDVVDEQCSSLRIERGNEYVRGKAYDFGGGGNLAFRKDVIGDSHIFRLTFSSSVFCDREMVVAIRDAGLLEGNNKNGLWFKDAADWSDL
jgi:Protein of unknown function (DUF1629)